jgi:hypothetical protein
VEKVAGTFGQTSGLIQRVASLGATQSIGLEASIRCLLEFHPSEVPVLALEVHVLIHPKF